MWAPRHLSSISFTAVCYCGFNSAAQFSDDLPLQLHYTSTAGCQIQQFQNPTSQLSPTDISPLHTTNPGPNLGQMSSSKWVSKGLTYHKTHYKSVFTGQITQPVSKYWKKPIGRWDQPTKPPGPYHHVTMNKHKATTTKHCVRVPVWQKPNPPEVKGAHLHTMSMGMATAEVMSWLCLTLTQHLQLCIVLPPPSRQLQFTVSKHSPPPSDNHPLVQSQKHNLAMSSNKQFSAFLKSLVYLWNLAGGSADKNLFTTGNMAVCNMLQVKVRTLSMKTCKVF